jgi:hypothetical protein
VDADEIADADVDAPMQRRDDDAVTPTQPPPVELFLTLRVPHTPPIRVVTDERGPNAVSPAAVAAAITI